MVESRPFIASVYIKAINYSVKMKGNIMNAFTNAVRNNQVIGETGNGGVTFNTTNSYVLDFFSAAGNRNVVLDKEFDLAFKEDPKLAYRVALWARDIRSGAGERQTFRNILKHLEKHYREDLIKLLPKIPEVGRFDDLLIFEDDTVKVYAFGIYREALNDKNGLAAKWAPRKGKVALELRNFLGYTPKQYRKTLVNLTKVVENQMCSREWDKINFDHVPSLASARYQKAFYRHCGEAYAEYKKGLTTVKEDGTTVRKINTGAVYPYDIVKSFRHGDRTVSKAQWNALPNFLGDDKILPVVDVSGSMSAWDFYGYSNKKGKNPTFTPMDIAISIGLYCADKQTGPFSGAFMTFTNTPKLKMLSGDFGAKVNQIAREVGYNTDIQAAFREILNVARLNNVPQADMPKILLVLSDMEFDPSVVGNNSVTAFNAARIMFEQAGYVLPKVVFWKINGRSDNSPVQQHESGTAIVSGFSPAIFKSILKGNLEQFSPQQIMLDTLSNPKYDIAGLTM